MSALGEAIRRTDAWGRTVFDPQSAFDMLYRGVDPALLVYETGTHEIERYNASCRRFNHGDHLMRTIGDAERSPQEEHAARAARWDIPDSYLEIDVQAWLLKRCGKPEQMARVKEEMALYRGRGLEDILRTMMFLVDHFRRTGAVWGVGRGSSVASYCLFLIGVHKIDSLAYDLKIEEFLRPVV